MLTVACVVNTTHTSAGVTDTPKSKTTVTTRVFATSKQPRPQRVRKIAKNPDSDVVGITKRKNGMHQEQLVQVCLFPSTIAPFLFNYL